MTSDMGAKWLHWFHSLERGFYWDFFFYRWSMINSLKVISVPWRFWRFWIFFSFKCLCFTDEMSAIDHIVHPQTWKVWRICYHQDFLWFLVNIWCVVLIFHICQGRMMTCKWICDGDECPMRSYPFSDQRRGKLCCPGNSLLEKVLF